MKVIASKYIPADMYTYQHKEIRSILKSHNTWDEIIFWMLFYEDIALFIMASLPYFFVFTVLTFNKPLEDLEVSYLCESKEKVNQWLKIGGRLKLIDLLINKQISIIIFCQKV